VSFIVDLPTILREQLRPLTNSASEFGEDLVLFGQIWY